MKMPSLKWDPEVGNLSLWRRSGVEDGIDTLCVTYKSHQITTRKNGKKIPRKSGDKDYYENYDLSLVGNHKHVCSM